MTSKNRINSLRALTRGMVTLKSNVDTGKFKKKII